MKRSDTLGWSQLKVAMVLLAGFAILVWVAFNSNIGGMFEKRSDLSARLADAQGITSGAPVFFLGIEAGKITSLTYDAKAVATPIALTLEVRDEFRRSLRSDAYVRVSAFGVIGDKFLELERGTAADPLPEGTVLPGRVEGGIADLIEPGRRAMTKVDGLLTELETISIGVREGKGTIGKLLADEDVHDHLLATLQETQTALADFRKTQRDMGQQLTSAASSIASTAGSFDSLATDWRTGEGTIRRLAEDPALYENLNAAAARLEHVLAEVERGDGLLSRLLKDPEFANEVTGLVVDLRALLVDMREHPGKYVQFSVF
jgi:phospholipid/cholesterol/gamma-HCH transport system substrate-binding protein